MCLKKQIYHAGNNVEVIKKLLKTKDAIGLIDEDPQGSKPKDFKRFFLNKDFSEYGFYIYSSENGNQLIVLRPKLEEWFLKISKKSGLSLKNYRLPEDPDKLHKIININLKEFKNALKKLLDLKNKELLKVKEILGGKFYGR